MNDSFRRVGSVSTLVLLGAISLSAQSGPPPAPVRVAEAIATRMTAQTWAPGTVVSRADARIAAEGAGQLTWVAEVGDIVRRGAPVARIDRSSLAIQLKNDEAQIKRLEAALTLADQQLARSRRLAAEQIVAANALEQAEAQRETASQNLAAAHLAREQTQFRISRLTVRAPFAGRVVERYQQAGSYASVGLDVVRLVNVEDLEVSARAPLSVEPFLVEGLEVVVEGDGRRGTGRVSRIVRVGDERSRMFELRVAVDGRDWLVGGAVKVALPSSAPRDVVAVPRDALVLRSDAIYVFRVLDGDTVERVAVETGVGNGDLIEVSSEVNPGDRIVVRGGERLRPGQAVAVDES